jgi:hypothetical protein
LGSGRDAVDSVQQTAGPCSQPFERSWPEHQETEDEKEHDGNRTEPIRLNSKYPSNRAESDRGDRKGRNETERDEKRPSLALLTDGSAKKGRQDGQCAWRRDRENAGNESE